MWIYYCSVFLTFYKVEKYFQIAGKVFFSDINICTYITHCLFFFLNLNPRHPRVPPLFSLRLSCIHVRHLCVCERQSESQQTLLLFFSSLTASTPTDRQQETKVQTTALDVVVFLDKFFFKKKIHVIILLNHFLKQIRLKTFNFFVFELLFSFSNPNFHTAQ